MQARKLGPWSSAMELIEARAAAVEARKGRLAAKAGDLASEDIEWTPPRDPGLGPRPYKSVDTLFRSCVRLIVENIDDIDTLVGIPELIKVNLLLRAPLPCSKGKMWLFAYTASHWCSGGSCWQEIDCLQYLL